MRAGTTANQFGEPQDEDLQVEVRVKRNEIPIDLTGFATDPNVTRMLEIFARLEEIDDANALFQLKRDTYIHRVTQRAAMIRWQRRKEKKAA